MRTTMSTQPKRHREGLALVVVVVACAFLAAACGGSEQASARMTSEVRPEAPPSELDLPDDLGGLGDLGDLGDLGEIDPDELFGELDDQLQEFADGMDGFGACAQLAYSLGELVIVPFTSSDPSADIDRIIGELEPEIPADLQDELDTVEEARRSADGGLMAGAGAMSTPEFSEAYQALANWVGTTCSAGATEN